MNAFMPWCFATAAVLTVAAGVLRNPHAEVHLVAAVDHSMHRIEVEQIPDHNLCTHVA
jgi:hypothetical protein